MDVEHWHSTSMNVMILKNGMVDGFAPWDVGYVINGLIRRET